MYVRNKNVIRAVLSGVAVLGAVFAPPWIPLIAIVLLAIFFRAWEALLIGLFLDLLWFPDIFFVPVPLCTIAAILIVWGFEPLRKEFLI